MDYEQLSRSALIRMLQEHDAALLEAGKDGIVMSYSGRAAPWQIIRMVKPKLSRIVKKVSAGEEKAQSENEIWDGENLSAMVTLYKYRGQVDLILTDPPYNTGEDFRYNDKWDKDPNDPNLGDLVPKDDGSRHSKWLRFMTPRVWMMREMLKPGGVIAMVMNGPDGERFPNQGVYLELEVGHRLVTTDAFSNSSWPAASWVTSAPLPSSSRRSTSSSR
mgnify:CR=1 FL=1